MTNSATETKSMGLRADAQVGSVFCSPFIKCTVTSNSFSLPENCLKTIYRDKKFSSAYRDLQKTRQPDTSLRSGQAPTATNQTAEPLAKK